MKLIFLLLLIFLIEISLVFANDVIKTKGGDLNVNLIDNKTCQGQIKNKTVFEFACVDQYPPQSLGLFKLKDKNYSEVLILQEAPMGNACNGGPLHLFGVNSNNQFTNLGTIDFCGGKDPIIKTTKNTITITFPTSSLNHGDGTSSTEKWQYTEGKISKLK